MIAQIMTSMPAQNIPVVKHPLEACAWCWSTLHPEKAFPDAWSSTICVEHEAWILRQAAERRARRATENCAAMKRPPRQMTVSELIQEARNETARFQKKQPTDHSYAFELFSRAIVLRDEQAWAGVYQLYHIVVGSWLLRRKPGLSTEDREALVNESFAKFSRSIVPLKLSGFPSTQALLGYLKCCANSVIADHCRLERVRQCEDSLESLGSFEQESLVSEDPVESVMIRLISQEVWQVIRGEVSRREERLVLQLMCMHGWSARELQQRYPLLFPTIKDVYREKRNVITRLQRNRDLQAILQGCA